MSIARACLVCHLKPDVKCNQCKKAYCGDCWKFKNDLCHNAPYIPINGWDYSLHKSYAR